jgi:hypothetical protein
MCKTLKKLSGDKFQPYLEVSGVIEEIKSEIANDKKLGRRVMRHLILYAEYQFGVRVIGKNYRERESANGCTRIDNWRVEIQTLIPLYIDLIYFIERDTSIKSVTIRNNLLFPCFEKMLNLLQPWSILLDSKSGNGCLNKRQISRVLDLLTQTESRIATFHIFKNQFDIAKSHSYLALKFARLYEGTEEEINKTEVMSRALRACFELHRSQGDNTKALIFIEEMYNCVAITYNPVHSKVQEASSMLITCLTEKGDLGKAEIFAQVTLDSLKDPKNGLDQQSEEMARGYYDLAMVLNRDKGGDLVKAENLARESLRIRSLLYNDVHIYISYNTALLASNLMLQGKLGSETRGLFERSLAIIIANSGPDATNTAITCTKLGSYYQIANIKLKGVLTSETKEEYSRLSKLRFTEAHRIYTKIFGPNHPSTMEVTTTLRNLK